MIMLTNIYHSWFLRVVFWTTTLFAFAFWLFPNSPLFVGLQILVTAGAAGVIVAYSEHLPAAILARKPSPFQKILLAIVGGFLALLGASFLRFVWRLAGEPDWFVASWMLALPVWLHFQSALMHIEAQGALGPNVPTPQRIRLAVVVFGVMLAFLWMVAYSEQVSATLETLRPWLEEVR